MTNAINWQDALLHSSWLAILLAFLLADPCRAQPVESKGVPEFSVISRCVERYFQGLDDHKPGDLISRGEVEPLFDALERLGWSTAAKPAILRRLPADTDLVVEQLRTEAGKKFMRKISKYPGAYDRLYRLSGLPNGRKLVSELIHTKGGHEMIEFLTTSRHGEELSQQLGKTAKGARFDEPVRKAFTADDLVKLLSAAHKVDVQAARQN
jgi:hypothetical protein